MGWGIFNNRLLFKNNGLFFPIVLWEFLWGNKAVIKEGKSCDRGIPHQGKPCHLELQGRIFPCNLSRNVGKTLSIVSCNRHDTRCNRAVSCKGAKELWRHC